jgi:predicted nucleic acid-binding protein
VAHYLDTSAFLKLVVTEPETGALWAWVTGKDRRLFSSDLLRTEALRTARRHSAEALALARARLDGVTLLSLTADVCARAAELDPAILRSLDALHLATALTLADELEGIVTYDERLGVAARLHGVAVVEPTDR